MAPMKKRKSETAVGRDKSPKLGKTKTDRSRKTVAEPAEPKKDSGKPKDTLSQQSVAKTRAKSPAISKPLVAKGQPGQLFVFGSNDAGQLAFEDAGVTKRYPFLFAPEKTGGHPVIQCAAGGMHSAVLTSEGQVYTWGCNDEGALGTGKSENEDDWKPKLITAISEKVIQITAGDSHTAFLTDEGQIYMVGTMRDPSGSFGLKISSSEPTTVPFLLVDSKGKGEKDVIKDKAVKIASGHNHFAYLNTHGEVHVLGDMSNGQLGPIPTYRSDGGRTGKAYFLQRRKVFIKNGRKFLTFDNVRCTPYGTFVHDKSSDAWWACGNNTKNQLGFEHEEGSNIYNYWTEVVGLRDKKVWKIVGTTTYTHALSEDGSLYVFGYKEYLGLSADVDNGVTTEPIRHPAGLEFADVDCSSNNATVAVTKEGDLYAWGSPSSSVLGTDPDEDDAVPIPMQIKSKQTEAFKMTSVAVGALHALLIGQKRE